MRTIGIYGGTFSPPHLGHRRVVEAFIRQEKPDEMQVIPTLIPPHKLLHGDATPAQRMEMCRRCFAGLPVTVSDREIRRGGKSYTVLTLEELTAQDTRLVFLCGTDMFMTLDTWREPERIFALSEIVYACRESGAAAVSVRQALSERAELYRTRYGARTRPLVFDALEISSERLRQMLARGEDTTAWLHPDVRRYIDKWQLYR